MATEPDHGKLATLLELLHQAGERRRLAICQLQRPGTTECDDVLCVLRIEDGQVQMLPVAKVLARGDPIYEQPDSPPEIIGVLGEPPLHTRPRPIETPSDN